MFDDDIDFENLEVEVNSSTMKRNPLTHSHSFGDTTDLESEGDYSEKKKNHDALVIEYCPRIFRELRKLDEYNAEEMDM